MWEDEYRDYLGNKLKVTNVKNLKRCVERQYHEVDELEDGSCGWCDEMFEEHMEKLKLEGWKVVDVVDYTPFNKCYIKNKVSKSLIRRHYLERDKVFYYDVTEY